jgi:hypothetical protein
MASIHTPGIRQEIQRSTLLRLLWEDKRLRRISFRGPAPCEENPEIKYEAEWFALTPSPELRDALGTGPVWLIDVLGLIRLRPKAALDGQIASVEIDRLSPLPEDPTEPGNVLGIETRRRTLTVWRPGQGNLPWPPGQDSAFALQGLAAHATAEEVEAYALWLLNALYLLDPAAAKRTTIEDSAFVNFHLV